MNPLVYVSITLHFEVTDSKMFGGKGSVGYTSTNFGGIENPENLKKIDELFIDSQIQSVAKMLEVSPENVKLISKEKYDYETQDDVEDDFEGDEW